MARRKITQAEKDKISDLSDKGFDDAYIAKELGWTHKSAIRSVAEQRRLVKSNVDQKTSLNDMSLDQMSKEDRYSHIKAKFASNARTIFILDSFSKDEQQLFADEYFNILKSTDSLTEPEEQQLFTATLEFLLAMRALKMKTQEERLYNESMRGQIPRMIKNPLSGKDEVNPQFRSSLDGRFENEYNNHITSYNRMMDSLKMSRKQRLEKIKQDRKTIADLAMELSNADAQSNAADEIERLAKMQDEELRRLLDNGHIMGKFGE